MKFVYTEPSEHICVIILATHMNNMWVFRANIHPDFKFIYY